MATNSPRKRRLQYTSRTSLHIFLSVTTLTVGQRQPGQKLILTQKRMDSFKNTMPRRWIKRHNMAEIENSFLVGSVHVTLDQPRQRSARDRFDLNRYVHLEEVVGYMHDAPVDHLERFCRALVEHIMNDTMPEHGLETRHPLLRRSFRTCPREGAQHLRLALLRQQSQGPGVAHHQVADHATEIHGKRCGDIPGGLSTDKANNQITKQLNPQIGPRVKKKLHPPIGQPRPQPILLRTRNAEAQSAERNSQFVPDPLFVSRRKTVASFFRPAFLGDFFKKGSFTESGGMILKTAVRPPGVCLEATEQSLSVSTCIAGRYAKASHTTLRSLESSIRESTSSFV